MKKRALLLVVASLFIASPTVVSAYYKTGNDLLDNCNEAINALESQSKVDMSKANECFGYITASFDMYEFMTIANKDTHTVCMEQEKITSAQLVRIVVKYLKEHPEKLHYPASYSVLFALSEAFPCP